MKQVLAGETIHSVYGLGGTLLYRDNASTGERTDYIALGGHPVGRFDAAGGFTWTAGDHLGSTSLALDGAAGVLWRESYTPFGEVRNNPAVNRDEAGFTGHVRDQGEVWPREARKGLIERPHLRPGPLLQPRNGPVPKPRPGGLRRGRTGLFQPLRLHDERSGESGGSGWFMLPTARSSVSVESRVPHHGKVRSDIRSAT